MDEVESINKHIKLLKHQYVWTIFVISHCGYRKDLKIATKLSNGVSLIIGGHSHTILYNNNDVPFHVEGNYPTIVKNSAGESTLVVTAGYYGLFIGNLTISFTPRGKVKNYTGEPIFMNFTFKKDPEVEKELRPFIDGIQEYKEKIGEIKKSFYFKLCMVTECLLGDLAADSIMKHVKNLNDPQCKPDMVLLSPFRFVADVLKGEITTADFMVATKIRDKLECVHIEGGTIRQAVLRGFNQTLDMKFPRQMLQISGIKITMDFDTEKLTIIHNDAPMKINKEYTVLITENLLEGKDGFTMMTSAKPIKTFRNTLKMITDHIKELKVVDLKLDKRIHLIGDPELEQITLLEQQMYRIDSLH